MKRKISCFRSVTLTQSLLMLKLQFVLSCDGFLSHQPLLRFVFCDKGKLQSTALPKDKAKSLELPLVVVDCIATHKPLPVHVSRWVKVNGSERFPNIVSDPSVILSLIFVAFPLRFGSNLLLRSSLKGFTCVLCYQP